MSYCNQEVESCETEKQKNFMMKETSSFEGFQIVKLKCLIIEIMNKIFIVCILDVYII